MQPVSLRSSLSRAIATAFVASALVSCGGGDDDSQASAAPPASSPPPASQPPPGDDNRAPVIAGSPPAEIRIGDGYSFAPTASDPDGDLLTFSVQNLPAWASFNEQTGVLSGTPNEGHQGTYSNIRISVTDGAATANLAPFSIDVVSNGLGSAVLTWSPPTQKEDGTAVELAGYRVYWGKASGNYTDFEEVGTDVVTHVVDDLTSGTWYFAVTAVDPNGIESNFSNEASKQIM